MRLLLVIILSLIATIYSLTDQITSWTLGSNTMPFKNRCQAIGYDQYTGIIHLLGGACPTCHTHYVTYNTLTNTMSALQSIPNSGRGSDQPYAQYYIQIKRILYIYNFENQCIDTFDMSTTTFTSCWSSIGTLIPTNSLKACMAIDDSARYFYLIPETNAFFFYDKVEQIWYSGPNTFQSSHLFPGCDVVNNKLYFWGGQVAWGQWSADLLTLEYLDISDMNALKTNPSSFSWNIQHNFLPFGHDFVRNFRLNDGMIYSVGGYRYSGDGQNIEVFAIDLSINQLQRSIDIPTKAIGGSLVWDSCQNKFYYFGGFDGSSDHDTFWYSNTISTANAPSKYQMDCMVSQFTTTTTTTSAVSTTSELTVSTSTTLTAAPTISSMLSSTNSVSTHANTTIRLNITNSISKLISDDTDLTTLEIILICICIMLVCICGWCYWLFYLTQGGKNNKSSSYSAIDNQTTNQQNNIQIKVQMTASVPTMGENDANRVGLLVGTVTDTSEKEKIRYWMEHTVGFPQYTDHFVLNGYDTFDIIADITDKADLEDIGITLKGHQARIIKKISMLKNERSKQNPVSWCSKMLIEWTKNDVLQWIHSINLSEQWLKTAIKGIESSGCDGTCLSELKSKNDISDLLGIDNPMLSARIWKQLREIQNRDINEEGKVGGIVTVE